MVQRVLQDSSHAAARPKISLATARLLMSWLPIWGGALVAGWTALWLLMFVPALRDSPSFIAERVPTLFSTVLKILPGWLTVPNAGAAARWTASLFYLAITISLWCAYLAALRTLRPISATPDKVTIPSFRFVLAGLLIFGALAMGWMSLFSSDVFDYAIQGKMQVQHGLNPFINVPATMGNEPFLQLTPWENKLTVYGPLMLLITKFATFVAETLGGTPVVYVLLYRAISLTLLAAGTALLWAIGGQLGWGADRRIRAITLFAWCPLVITELIGSAHNDSMLILCILVAIYLHLRGLWPLALAALLCGGMIKLSGYFLLPAYLVLLVRTSLDKGQATRRLLASVAIVLGVAFAGFAPYLHPNLGNMLMQNPMSGFVANSTAAMVRQGLVDASLLLRGALTPADLTWRQALEVVRYPLWYGPIFLWAILALVFSLRVRNFDGLVHAWFLVFFSYLLIGSVWNMPWYATWIVPLLALMPESRLRWAGMWLIFGSLISRSLWPIMDFLPGIHPQRLPYYYMPTIMVLPLLLYAIGTLIQSRTHRQRQHLGGFQAS